MTELPSRNLELKVRLRDGEADRLRSRIAQVVCQPVEVLQQVDEYFRVDSGRLKLRMIGTPKTGSQPARAELIAYQRPMHAGSRWSDYVVVPVSPDMVDALQAALAATHATIARVEKRREVVVIGHTRVHLDEVSGLGEFAELETVIEGQDEASAMKEHQDVISLLGLDGANPVEGSYLDLVAMTGGKS